MSATLTCSDCGKVVRRTAGALRRWRYIGDRTGVCPGCQSVRMASMARNRLRCDGRRQKAEVAR